MSEEKFKLPRSSFEKICQLGFIKAYAFKLMVLQLLRISIINPWNWNIINISLYKRQINFLKMYLLA